MLQPAFFDIFGLAAFGFIAALSIWALKTQKNLPKWTLIILSVFGVIGFFIDSLIVYITYIK